MNGTTETACGTALGARTDETHQTGVEQKFYRPELDTIRFAAFLSVFMLHMLPPGTEAWIKHGLSGPAAGILAKGITSLGYGVDLFFLLSSYLITALLIREHKQTGRIDLRSFYIRRALRIWPLYYLFLILTFAVLPRFGYPGIASANIVAFPLFAGNWSTAFVGLPASPAAPLWSVSIEEQFYLIWPALLWAFGLRGLRTMALMLFVVAVAARLAFAAMATDTGLMGFSTFTRLDPIAAGALIAHWQSGPVRPLQGTLRGVMMVAGVLLLPAAAVAFDTIGYGASFNSPLRTLGCSLILTAVVTGPVPWPMKNRLLVYLGKISYGLYVYHMLVMDWSRYIHAAMPGTAGFLLTMTCALAGTILISSLSYALIERPFLRLKARYTHIASRPA